MATPLSTTQVSELQSLVPKLDTSIPGEALRKAIGKFYEATQNCSKFTNIHGHDHKFSAICEQAGSTASWASILSILMQLSEGQD